LAPLVWIPFALKVWVEHSKEPCDVPLPGWLESYLLYTLLMPYCKAALLRAFCGWNPTEENDSQPFRVKVFNQVLDSLPIVWFGIARMFISESKTCKTTNPTLFKFVDWFSSFMVVFLIVRFVVLAIGVVLFTRFISRNGGELPEWVQTILQRANAASPDTIHKIDTVEYDSTLFADPSDPGDERPAGECCICLQAYDAELEIKRTQCGHLAHTTCLEEWLKRARTCPTCRKDLEEACSEEAAPLAQENCDSDTQRV
jgi:hypothetical protein